MHTRSTPWWSVFLAAGIAHCGNALAPTDTDAATPHDAAADAAAPTDVATDTPVIAQDVPAPRTCAQVQAACGAAPATFVRGHASGLTGLENARVQFAVRYILQDGVGLDTPHGVEVGEGTIQNGAFEACVCIPYGASDYPQIAAVVFAPGSTSEIGRDVVRAAFSQRYATLGDEDLTSSLSTAPSTPEAEAALAGMSARTAQVAVHGLDAANEGYRLYGGLVADERLVAAQIQAQPITAGAVAFDWNMPGRAWPSESLVLLVDRNADGICNAGDLGARIRLDGRTDVTGIGGPWLEGADLNAICAALSIDVGRER